MSHISPSQAEWKPGSYKGNGNSNFKLHLEELIICFVQFYSQVSRRCCSGNNGSEMPLYTPQYRESRSGKTQLTGKKALGILVYIRIDAQV
jgi:hypothetical protein